MTPPSKKRGPTAQLKEEAVLEEGICLELSPEEAASIEGNETATGSGQEGPEGSTAGTLHGIDLPEEEPPPKKPLWESLLSGAIILLACGVLAGLGYVDYMLGKISRPEDVTVTVAEEVLEKEFEEELAEAGAPNPDDPAIVFIPFAT